MECPDLIGRVAGYEYIKLKDLEKSSKMGYIPFTVVGHSAGNRSDRRRYRMAVVAVVVVVVAVLFESDHKKSLGVAR